MGFFMAPYFSVTKQLIRKKQQESKMMSNF